MEYEKVKERIADKLIAFHASGFVLVDEASRGYAQMIIDTEIKPLVEEMIDCQRLIREFSDEIHADIESRLCLADCKIQNVRTSLGYLKGDNDIKSTMGKEE